MSTTVVGTTARPHRFAELFERIRAGAAERERERTLPHAEIRALAAAGFTALRVPVEFGGGGATLPEVFELLIELAAADSNIPQALRGHFGFVERLLAVGGEQEEEWFRRISAGELIGNAQAESGAVTAIDTRLARSGDGWRLDGRKFYTTGTIYADHTWVTATDGTENYGAVVPTTAVGVDVVDDWNGLGQRLTGSGTTTFDDVRLTDAQVFAAGQDAPWVIVDVRVFFHLLLQATMVGIGEAALADTIEVVRARSRSFGVPGRALPRDDVRVHTVLGELSSRVAAARAFVLDVAADYERVKGAAHPDDEARVEDFVRLQIRQFQAQQIAVADIVRVTSDLYEVGGASLVAAGSGEGLDRHWRNARTIASHNPAIFRKAAIGDWLLNGTIPERSFR